MTELEQAVAAYRDAYWKMIVANEVNRGYDGFSWTPKMGAAYTAMREAQFQHDRMMHALLEVARRKPE